MNKVILMGRLTKNPEIKYAGKDNDMAVARYTLAVNRRYKRDGEKEADLSPVSHLERVQICTEISSQGNENCDRRSYQHR